MESGARFNAPWGTSLKVVTGVSVVILISIPILGAFIGSGGNTTRFCGMIMLPLLILFIASFFLIRGYVLTDTALSIQRLGWNYTLDLTTLMAAEADKDAMARSIRMFGNGGLFCFAGAFRNKKLGSYRAFATDPKRAVVLKFVDRVVVITPDKPEEFVTTIKDLKRF
jgi:hypothetical protein